MENYIVSARKYRPATFQSVVGQSNLTKTLQNAIATNHLAHAYLFCGPRGVGKTTCARIFAKTINCTHLTPQQEACNECPSCQSFNEHRSLNIHELDAASNNSVDDIRQLIEQVHIPPQLGRYSVYIIDEVHMLSTSAFNALLKTLEEPPSHVIFIMATTEKHKVIPTILSRCQVFDFSRISNNDIVNHLQYVAQQEGIEVATEALDVVAQKADGGLRDALSIFDQLYAFCGSKISYEQTIHVLNVLDSDYYFKMVECMLNQNVFEALTIFDAVLNRGFDGQNFIVGLMQHLRNLLVVKDERSANLTDVSETIQKKFIVQSHQCPASLIFRALDVLNTCEVASRTAKNRRLTLELGLIRLCEGQDTSNHNQQQPLNIPSNAPANNSSSGGQDAIAPSNNESVSKPSSPKKSIPKSIDTTPQPFQKTTERPTPTHIPNMISIHPVEPVQSISQTQLSISTFDNSFSNQQLQEAWLQLKDVFASDLRMVQNIENHLPTIDEDGKIVIKLTNDLQKQDMLTYNNEIKQHLQNCLNAPSIQLKYEVEENKREFVSEDRKLQDLVNEYPVVTQFINKLGLTLDC